MRNFARFLSIITLVLVFEGCLLSPLFNGTLNDEILVRYENNISLDYPSESNESILTVSLPMKYSQKQKIIRETFSTEPEIITDGDNRYARFNLSDRHTNHIKISIILKLSKSEFDSRQKNGACGISLSDEAGILYVQDEKYLETNNRELQEAGKLLKENSDLDTVKNIYRFVQKHIRYKKHKNNNDYGALYAYQTKRGDCTEYADLFVALCRVNGIPARQIKGCTAGSNTKNILHSWAEAFVPEFGWLSFDPTWDDHDLFTRFDSMRNAYIYMSNIRNESLLYEYSFSCISSRGAITGYSIIWKTQILKQEDKID